MGAYINVSRMTCARISLLTLMQRLQRCVQAHSCRQQQIQWRPRRAEPRAYRQSAVWCRHAERIGQAFLPRGLGTSCWMDTDKQHPLPIRTVQPASSENPFVSYLMSCVFLGGGGRGFPSPHSFFFCGISLMHVYGCHRDLALSVTACSTLLIHFRFFGIHLLFFYLFQSFFFCLQPENAALKTSIQRQPS